jgi:hypothetical protein
VDDVHRFDCISIFTIFDSGNAVLRKTFTPPPPHNGQFLVLSRNNSMIHVSGRFVN